MENLNIASWNVKNSYFNLSKNSAKVDAIVDLLEKENLDILGLQEVNYALADDITNRLNELNNGYRFIYNYSKQSRNKINDVCVEINPFIARRSDKFCFANGKELNSFIPKLSGIDLIKPMPSIRKRSVGKYVSLNQRMEMYNVHLDFYSEELATRQMEELLKMVGTSASCEPNYNRFLMGTFNWKPTDENMTDFLKKIESLKLKSIELNEVTYASHQDNLPVDYIMVPEDNIVDEVKVSHDYSEASSHYPVIAKVKY